MTIAPSDFTPLDPATPENTGSAQAAAAAAVGVALALFALVMLFLYSARSLQIVVDAQAPARVSVSGLALPFGKHYLLRPGSYEVNVTAEGYQSLVTTVVVDERDSQTVELSLQALPGLLSIDSEPPGASVTVDGKALGKTPLRDLPLEEGEHRLLLEEARHLPLEQSLLVTGRNVRQQLQLQLAPAWAQVTVDSLPPGARILVDGEAAGQTPATLEVLQGEHQLTLQLPSYADWQQTLNIKAGVNQDLGRVSLQSAPGVLELSSDPGGANVTLDGDFQGQTPLTLQVSPGRAHRLEVFKSGYQRYNGTVELPVGGRDQRAVTLQAQLGEVRLRISPANATVRINGKALARGAQTLSLPAVEHSIDISLDGYTSVRRSVTPRPGLPQLVEVTLQTPQSAAGRR